ncbi:MAG: helix-turn-helix domain-containing protein [Synechococcaceae cyanobacterium]|jgi:hypothetical protein
MIPKRLEEVTHDDLEDLIRSEIREGKAIDYKRDLPGNSEGEKKEFLYDVSSFANTVGGDLIIGVEEDKGLPAEIPAFSCENIDEEIRRLDSILISGVEPRLKYQIRAIMIPNGGHVLIVRVEKSGLAPHRVIYKGSDKFYARNSAGKYPLDVSELRDAFLLGASAATRLRDFRISRLASIAAGEGPLMNEGSPVLVLHLLPLAAFTSQQELDISKFYDTSIRPIGASSIDWQINIDGVLHFAANRERTLSNYVQVYRNGSIEVADEFAFTSDERGNRLAPLKTIEERINNHLPKYLECMKEIEARPPIYLFLSIVGGRGCRAYTGSLFSDSMNYPQLKRDPLMLPEMVIDDLTAGFQAAIRPLYNRLWNAFGFPESPF